MGLMSTTSPQCACELLSCMYCRPPQPLPAAGLPCAGNLFFRDFSKYAPQDRMRTWDSQFMRLQALPHVSQAAILHPLS
jgi:hypothetical protein